MGSPMWDFAGSDKDGGDDKAGERAGTFKRGDIYKMHAYRDAIPDARSVWILYPGGEFRFFGVPGGGGQSGNQAVSSPERLPAELQGVGAIPVAPVVGDTTGGGRRGASTSIGVLRETLRRMLGAGGGMSTPPYICRVRRWRGARRVRCLCPLAFAVVLSPAPIGPFPPPALRTGTCGFPASGSPVGSCISHAERRFGAALAVPVALRAPGSQKLHGFTRVAPRSNAPSGLFAP